MAEEEKPEIPMPTWLESDSDEDDTDFTEKAHICLMAKTVVFSKDDDVSDLDDKDDHELLSISGIEVAPKVDQPTEKVVVKSGNTMYAQGGKPRRSRIEIEASTGTLTTIKPLATVLSKIEEEFSDISKTEMAEEMATMLSEFENLKKIHFALKTDHKHIKMENEALKPEVEKLKAIASNLQNVEGENLYFKERIAKYAAQVNDLEKAKADLSKVVETFSKPKAAVKALVESQIPKCNHAGLGYEASSSIIAIEANSAYEIQTPPIKAKPLIEKDGTPSTRSGKYSSVPLMYKKERFHKKGKGKIYTEDEINHPKHQENTEKGKIKSVSVISARRKVSLIKKKPVKFVKAKNTDSLHPNQSKKKALKAPVFETSYIKCPLCECSNHYVHECLLRYTPFSKSKMLKMNQVWIPKSN
jgi:hypothetical protein